MFCHGHFKHRKSGNFFYIKELFSENHTFCLERSTRQMPSFHCLLWLQLEEEKKNCFLFCIPIWERRETGSV